MDNLRGGGKNIMDIHTNRHTTEKMNTEVPLITSTARPPMWSGPIIIEVALNSKFSYYEGQLAEGAEILLEYRVG